MSRMTSLSRRIVGLVAALGVAGWTCGVHADAAERSSVKKPNELCAFVHDAGLVAAAQRRLGVDAADALIHIQAVADTPLKLKTSVYVVSYTYGINPFPSDEEVADAVADACEKSPAGHA